MKSIRILFVIDFAHLIGRGKEYKVPDLGSIYTPYAREAHRFGNPVIVIPGILGSKLVDGESGQVVWGAFERGYANPSHDKVLAYLLSDVSDTAERREIVIDLLRKSLERAQQFQNAVGSPPSPPDGSKLYLIAGGAVPTHYNITFN